MESTTQVQVQNKTVGISLPAKALSKNMNLSSLLSAMRKIVGQSGFFCLCKVTSLEEGKF